MAFRVAFRGFSRSKRLHGFNAGPRAIRRQRWRKQGKSVRDSDGFVAVGHWVPPKKPNNRVVKGEMKQTCGLEGFWCLTYQRLPTFGAITCGSFQKEAVGRSL